MNNSKEQQFTNRIQKLLDQSVDDLDAVTKTRLKAARLTALEGLSGEELSRGSVLSAVFSHNKLLLATSMSVVVFVSALTIKQSSTEVPIDDLQILSAREELELFRDLEFYQWLEYQSEQS